MAIYMCSFLGSFYFHALMNKRVNLVPETVPAGLTSGIIYFGTSQYWCTVSGLPLFFIFINIYVCMYVCVCIINIKVYHKTLP